MTTTAASVVVSPQMTSVLKKSSLIEQTKLIKIENCNQNKHQAASVSSSSSLSSSSSSSSSSLMSNSSAISCNSIKQTNSMSKPHLQQQKKIEEAQVQASSQAQANFGSSIAVTTAAAAAQPAPAAATTLAAGTTTGRKRGRRRQQTVLDQPNGLDRVFIWDIDGSLVRSDTIADSISFESHLEPSVLTSVTDKIGSLAKRFKELTMLFCDENFYLNELESSDQMHIDDVPSESTPSQAPVASSAEPSLAPGAPAEMGPATIVGPQGEKGSSAACLMGQSGGCVGMELGSSGSLINASNTTCSSSSSNSSSSNSSVISSNNNFCAGGVSSRNNSHNGGNSNGNNLNGQNQNLNLNLNENNLDSDEQNVDFKSLEADIMQQQQHHQHQQQANDHPGTLLASNCLEKYESSNHNCLYDAETYLLQEDQQQQQQQQQRIQDISLHQVEAAQTSQEACNGGAGNLRPIYDEQAQQTSQRDHQNPHHQVPGPYQMHPLYQQQHIQQHGQDQQFQINQLQHSQHQTSAVQSQHELMHHHQQVHQQHEGHQHHHHHHHHQHHLHQLHHLHQHSGQVHANLAQSGYGGQQAGDAGNHEPLFQQQQAVNFHQNFPLDTIGSEPVQMNGGEHDLTSLVPSYYGSPTTQSSTAAPGLMQILHQQPALVDHRPTSYLFEIGQDQQQQQQQQTVYHQGYQQHQQANFQSPTSNPHLLHGHPNEQQHRTHYNHHHSHNDHHQHQSGLQISQAAPPPRFVEAAYANNLYPNQQQQALSGTPELDTSSYHNHNHHHHHNQQQAIAAGNQEHHQPISTAAAVAAAAAMVNYNPDHLWMEDSQQQQQQQTNHLTYQHPNHHQHHHLHQLQSSTAAMQHSNPVYANSSYEHPAHPQQHYHNQADLSGQQPTLSGQLGIHQLPSEQQQPQEMQHHPHLSHNLQLSLHEQQSQQNLFNKQEVDLNSNIILSQQHSNQINSNSISSSNNINNSTATLRTVLNNHHKQLAHKLSLKFSKIKQVYNSNRFEIQKQCSPKSATNNNNNLVKLDRLELEAILAEIDHYTLDWRKHSTDCLKLISESTNCTSIVITKLPLILAFAHLICLGLGKYFSIDQIYSSNKTNKETCLKRVRKKFGATNRCSYIIVGNQEDVELAKRLDLPAWLTSHNDGHRQLLQLYTALKEGYLM